MERKIAWIYCKLGNSTSIPEMAKKSSLEPVVNIRDGLEDELIDRGECNQDQGRGLRYVD